MSKFSKLYEIRDDQLKQVKIKIGRIKQDINDHNYLVPDEKVNEFDASIKEIDETECYTDLWYSLNDSFMESFGQYEIDGFEDLKILMEPAGIINEY